MNGLHSGGGRGSRGNMFWRGGGGGGGPPKPQGQRQQGGGGRRSHPNPYYLCRHISGGSLAYLTIPSYALLGAARRKYQQYSMLYRMQTARTMTMCNQSSVWPSPRAPLAPLSPYARASDIHFIRLLLRDQDCISFLQPKISITRCFGQRPLHNRACRGSTQYMRKRVPESRGDMFGFLSS